MSEHSGQQTALVTGAAGFVGRHIVSALLERGYRVRALVRRTSLALEHPNLDCISGDIQDAEGMRQACAGVDTVFHTAAYIATMGGSAATEAYRKQAFDINLGGTENLLSACREQGVGKLVHTSSVDVCFNGEEDLDVPENPPYATRFAALYPETKIAAEKAVLAANGTGGLLTCALRPDGIWGPVGSVMLDTLLEQLEAGRMVARIGGMGGLHDHVHVDNLVHAHLLVADALSADSPVAGRAYFITDGEPARMFEFARPFFEGLGYQVPRFNIPAGQLRPLMAAWQWLHFKLGLPEPLFTPHELDKLVISHVVSSEAAARDFGYAPIKSVAQGMEEAVAAYRALVASR